MIFYECNLSEHYQQDYFSLDFFDKENELSNPNQFKIFQVELLNDLQMNLPFMILIFDESPPLLLIILKVCLNIEH